MTKLLICADLHLGHENITKFRTDFSSAEEHDHVVFDNLASAVGKRDSLYLLGDVAFNLEQLNKIKSIKCAKKTLILGNHDTDRKVTISMLDDVFNSIHSLHCRDGFWFSHCPIHESQFRGKRGNIHGHLHNQTLNIDGYFNTSLEAINYRPIDFELVKEHFDFMDSIRV